MTRALVPLADGVEEMEAVIIIDTLRRSGWEVTAAAVDNADTVTGSRRVGLIPDASWADIAPAAFDCLLVPGGAGGAERLMSDVRLLAAIGDFAEAGKVVGAVCAGPLVLQKAGVLANRKATCHPAVKDSLVVTPWLPDRVAVDENIITSQAPGTTFEFALAIIEKIDGKQQAEDVAAGLILPGNAG